MKILKRLALIVGTLLLMVHMILSLIMLSMILNLLQTGHTGISLIPLEVLPAVMLLGT